MYYYSSNALKISIYVKLRSKKFVDARLWTYWTFLWAKTECFDAFFYLFQGISIWSQMTLYLNILIGLSISTSQWFWKSAFFVTSHKFISINDVRTFSVILTPPPPCWQFSKTIRQQFWPIFWPLPIADVVYGRPPTYQ